LNKVEQGWEVKGERLAASSTGGNNAPLVTVCCQATKHLLCGFELKSREETLIPVGVTSEQTRERFTRCAVRNEGVKALLNIFET
jgi:hypothetical protein